MVKIHILHYYFKYLFPINFAKIFPYETFSKYDIRQAYSLFCFNSWIQVYLLCFCSTLEIMYRLLQ